MTDRELLELAAKAAQARSSTGGFDSRGGRGCGGGHGVAATGAVQISSAVRSRTS